MRHVFFSFHYEKDIWRANQVRNAWVAQGKKDAGFWDAADWESVKRGGDQAIKKWIQNQMKGTSVTIVLIGTETASRNYVKYEMQHSQEIENGIMGIYIHKIKNRLGNTSSKGPNPFASWSGVKTYDWVNDDGYYNIGDWIEAAAKQAGR